MEGGKGGGSVYIVYAAFSFRYPRTALEIPGTIFLEQEIVRARPRGNAFGSNGSQTKILNLRSGCGAFLSRSHI